MPLEYTWAELHFQIYHNRPIDPKRKGIPQTNEKQSNQLPFILQGDHNARHDPLNNNMTINRKKTHEESPASNSHKRRTKHQNQQGTTQRTTNNRTTREQHKHQNHQGTTQRRTKHQNHQGTIQRTTNTRTTRKPHKHQNHQRTTQTPEPPGNHTKNNQHQNHRLVVLKYRWGKRAASRKLACIILTPLNPTFIL